MVESQPALPKKDSTPIFDPEMHLTLEEPSAVLSMTDLGYEDAGVSAVALVHPFPLFSFEAIKIMRAEIAKPEVRADHLYASSIASAQLRGYARKHAPFTFAAWNHPKTVAIISKKARIELVPWSDYEIAHINLSIETELASVQSRRTVLHMNEDDSLSSPTDQRPIVGWHRDAYPFVCILMLSNCTDMVGGETALRTSCGNVISVRAPTEGCAMILQGRYIEHQALPAVTSFRPQSPFVRDDSMLRTVRPV
jgi:hypothetical protein